MENAELNTNHNHIKTNLKRSSNSGHLSMSDIESTTSWHSPLRSPLGSDDASLQLEIDSSDDRYRKALVVVNNYSSPVPSPRKNSNFPSNSPAAGEKGLGTNPLSKKPDKENLDYPARSPEKHRLIDHLSESLDFPEEKKSSSEKYDFPAEGGTNCRVENHSPEKPMLDNFNVTTTETALVIVEINKLARNEEQHTAKNVVPIDGVDDLEEGHFGDGGMEAEVGGEKQSKAAVESILRRSRRNVAVRKAAFGFRVFEAVTCLVSFSVMAADKTQGWSGDSFDRYQEYRYCLAVNVIASLYASFQAFDVAYQLGTGKHAITHYLRPHFDFSMDQILAYLLMSASSSAATRVYDWTSNWGMEEFTLMASASIAMSFLAFVAFAFSSLISGYNLCNWDST